jgi:hypothetical protein
MKTYKAEKTTRMMRTLKTIVNSTDDETLDNVIKIIIDKVEFYDHALSGWDNPHGEYTAEVIETGKKCCNAGLDMADAIVNELRISYLRKPTIHLCDKHFAHSDWSDRDVIRTGRASCDICKEK